MLKSEVESEQLLTALAELEFKIKHKKLIGKVWYNSNNNSRIYVLVKFLVGNQLTICKNDHDRSTCRARCYHWIISTCTNIWNEYQINGVVFTKMCFCKNCSNKKESKTEMQMKDDDFLIKMISIYISIQTWSVYEVYPKYVNAHFHNKMTWLSFGHLCWYVAVVPFWILDN